MVVNVCTVRWNFVERISASRMAKAIGSQLVAIPRPLIIRVFRSTCRILEEKPGSLISIEKLLNPTKISLVSSSPALAS